MRCCNDGKVTTQGGFDFLIEVIAIISLISLVPFQSDNNKKGLPVIMRKKHQVNPR